MKGVSGTSSKGHPADVTVGENIGGISSRVSANRGGGGDLWVIARLNHREAELETSV